MRQFQIKKDRTWLICQSIDCLLTHHCLSFVAESVAAFRHSPLEPSLTGSTCSHLRDGKYAMRDVFMYLECTKHVGTVKACKVGTYFDAVKRECVDNQHKLDASM